LPRGAGTAVGAPAILVGRARSQNQPAKSTIDRINRNKVLRIAALRGEAPYFKKDIAGVFDGEVQYLESTYGNSVLDLQANKIDLAFALNPTPKRALVIDFTYPFYLHGFGMVGAKGFYASTWADLDKPEVKIAVGIGSVHELGAHRFASKATIIGLKGARRLYPGRAIGSGRLRNPISAGRPTRRQRKTCACSNCTRRRAAYNRRASTARSRPCASFSQ
jgi:polar amino acid transport system substrate-binding protein